MKEATKSARTPVVVSPDGASKRAQVVIEHINKHGHITTEHLKSKYGYSHPPRAARDVRDAGVALETFRVVGSDGRKIAAYRFASTVTKPGGASRKPLSKQFKEQLIAEHGMSCAICGSRLEARYLQVDHRVPFLIAGESSGTPRIKDYQLLCASCNRAKSWSCENCTNRVKPKTTKVCRACYWHSPENYEHVATEQLRRETLVWQGREVKIHTALLDKAKEHDTRLHDHIKALLEKAVSPNPE